MDQEQFEYAPTAFDMETQSRNIQMLKTVIPYMDSSKQRTFALMIKFLELRNVASMFHEPKASLSMCSTDDPSEKRMQLLNDIKKFCTPAEQDSIDMILTAIQMLSSYDSFLNTPASE